MRFWPLGYMIRTKKNLARNDYAVRSIIKNKRSTQWPFVFNILIKDNPVNSVEL